MFAGRFGATHAGEHLGEMGPLHLAATIVRQMQVEVLADAPQRLLVLAGLATQALGVRTGQRSEQPLIVGVPLTGDFGQQGREADGRVVRVGTRAADGGRHQDRTRQHRRRFEQLFLGDKSVAPAIHSLRAFRMIVRSTNRR